MKLFGLYLLITLLKLKIEILNYWGNKKLLHSNKPQLLQITIVNIDIDIPFNSRNGAFSVNCQNNQSSAISSL
jgi:hypothetical protein